jgi:two-component system chemotaxis response regulator CheB
MAAVPTPEAPAARTAAETRVVALASSAGGLQALTEILSHLPTAFPAAVLVIQHLEPSRQSHMAEILSWHSSLPVSEAGEGDQLLPGHVFVAPANHHLLVNEDGTLSLSQTAPLHHVRPSADSLFRSIAANVGDRAVVVVLTGTGKDGAAGARAVKAAGGTVVAQNEATAAFFGMPGAAIDTGDVDFIVPLEKISSLLVRLASGETP